MTDAQQALAQVREALAAGPTPGPWQKATDWSRAAVIQSTKPFKRVVCTGNQNNDDRFGAEDWSGATWVDADFIARCNPENMRAILAHVEAQAAENERLTAALRHEADCVEAAKAEIERLTAENKMLRHTHRWNVSPQVDDSLLVCRHLHEKDEKCDLEHYVPAERLHDAIRERDELRRQLAEAEQDAWRYRWSCPDCQWRGLTRPAEEQR